MSLLGRIAGKRLLDVGSGNGIQAIYVYDHYAPARVVGIDINPVHIEHARAAAAGHCRPGLTFTLDDAQALTTAANESFDCELCVASAHHYCERGAFVNRRPKLTPDRPPTRE